MWQRRQRSDALKQLNSHTSCSDNCSNMASCPTRRCVQHLNAKQEKEKTLMALFYSDRLFYDILQRVSWPAGALSCQCVGLCLHTSKNISLQISTVNQHWIHICGEAFVSDFVQWCLYSTSRLCFTFMWAGVSITLSIGWVAVASNYCCQCCCTDVFLFQQYYGAEGSCLWYWQDSVLLPSVLPSRVIHFGHVFHRACISSWLEQTAGNISAMPEKITNACSGCASACNKKGRSFQGAA